MGVKLKQLSEALNKYRYVALILCVGLLLMLIPSKSQNKTLPSTSTVAINTSEESIESQLETILSQVYGAGRVKVFLTVDVGQETIYQANTSVAGERSDKTIVIVTDAERNQSGLIQKINYPRYRRAIIVCDGAQDPTVRLEIVDAVSKATGLGANQISILKLK